MSTRHGEIGADSRSAGRPRGQKMQPKAGRMTEHRPKISEVHILWITGGLGCDGDSVSITAASQPSIEDVVLGAIPGLPKVHLHNAVLSYTVGDEFMAPFHQAARGELSDFVLDCVDRRATTDRPAVDRFVESTAAS